MMRYTLNEQIDRILQGTVDVIQKTELVSKLTKSIETNRPLKIKLGCDPNRPDIHLGHTVPLTKLKLFQDLGHTVIFIIGDFTGFIGDPSDKESTRPMISLDEVHANAKTYFDQVGKILDIEKAQIVYNSTWLSSLNFAKIIDLTSRYTVARILERNDFANRFKNEKPISIQEFLYPLAQAYDSVHVGADIEIGGTDQRFNFVLARDIQKSYNQSPEVVITLPLLIGLDGVHKMSKSLNNYIGITDSGADMFGKIMSLSDTAMATYYNLLTDQPMPSAIHPMEAKKQLAEIIVTRFHGHLQSKNARDEFERVFSKHHVPSDVPIIVLAKDDFKEGSNVWIVQLMKKANFVKSSGEAIRLIKSGAVSVDGEKILDTNTEIDLTNPILLKVGPKRFARFKK